MSNKYYLVWKDEKCNGKNPEWIYMNGKTFYRFLEKPENKHRFFITLDNRICEDADTIIIECTEEEYKRWRIEKHREEYLDKCKNEYCSYSISTDTIPFVDRLVDESVNIEDDFIRVVKNQLLKEFLASLNKKEKDLINLLYVKNDGLSELKISKKTGIPRKTLNDRKLKIREKLRNFYAKNGFCSDI